MDLMERTERISNEARLDLIRGCLIGGAAGDALGYPVEFQDDCVIFRRYGKKGITAYALDRRTGKAVISDDTQMTLFTANGLLVSQARGCKPREGVAQAYLDWLHTQDHDFGKHREGCVSWLCDVPELYARRAPGNTCLSALRTATFAPDYIAEPRNNSKGCGGVMRVAPIALQYWSDIEQMDMEAAQLAAITHGNSLGYMPAAVLCHIIQRIVFYGKRSLKDIVLEAKEIAKKLFSGDQHLQELTELIDRAVAFSENDDDDLENIKRLGEGWVAEETLAISIYCSLKHSDDFSKGIIAAVNHSGDSDSTGAVTGNILGALLGYRAIGDQWKNDLQCADVILEIADDLCLGANAQNAAWVRKYIEIRRI